MNSIPSKAADSIRFSGIAVLLIVCFSCSDDPEPSYEDHVIDYFKSVALGFEYGSASQVTRKWEGTMRVFVGGDKHNAELLDDLNAAIEGINALATDGFSIEITSDSAACNSFIFFGTREQFVELFPDAAANMGTNLALFNVWWNDQSVIYKSRIFIATKTTTPEEIKSLILEEVTQSVGLGKDSPKYPESIFYETPGNGGFATEYSRMDEDLIRLLYHPDMPAGIGASTVDHVIRKIFAKENW